MSESPTSVQWFTVTEACEYLRVSKATLYIYMKDGRLPFYYLAGTSHRRVRKEDAEKLFIRGNPDDITAEDDSEKDG